MAKSNPAPPRDPYAPVPVTSDEGVPCLELPTGELVSTEADTINRFELHLRGKTYTHCGELGAAWMYRP